MSRAEIAGEIRFCAHVVLADLAAFAGVVEAEIARKLGVRCFARRASGWRPIAVILCYDQDSYRDRANGSCCASRTFAEA